MKDINIRQMEPSDIQKLSQLLVTREELDMEGAEIRAELMGWTAFSNPYTDNDETTYYLAEHEGKIIAFHGRMPVQLIVDQNPTKGYYVHDLYVDPEFRKKGLGFWLTMSLAKAIEDDSEHLFLLLGMTPLNKQMQRRRGYYETEINGFHKLLNPKKQVKKVVKSDILTNLLTPLATLGLRFADWIWSFSLNTEIKVHQADRFDEGVDKLFNQVKHKLNLTTCRSSEYLNWKYVDRPYPRETVLVSRKEGNMTGYLILSDSPVPEKYPKGLLIEIFTDPDDTASIKALLNAAVKYCRQKRFYTLNGLFSDPRIIKVFKKYMFLKIKGKSLMIGNLKNYEDKANYIKNVKNWHITLGESDAFMLKT